MRLHEPPHTTGQYIYHPKHLLCIVFDSKYEFLRFKEPKTKRCKTLIPKCLAHTFTATQGTYGANSGAKVRISEQISKFYLRYFEREYLHPLLQPFCSKIFIHSLAQRTNQETSTPYQTTPYMGCLNLKSSETKLFRLFWYRGTRDIFLSAGAQKPGHGLGFQIGATLRNS